MADKWTTVNPIPWRDTSFTYLPYWLYDIIVKAFKDGNDWRDYSETKYKLEFDTLIQAFEDYDDISVIESRNGNLHDLSNFTPVTITAKSPVPAFKVGDPDLVISALFTIDPVKLGQHAVLSVDASGHAVLSSSAVPSVKAVSAGTTVVTCTIGDVSETISLVVTV
ncbi:Hoc-like head decoration [Escherichia phage EcS1]|uniref:Hoc large outer capsid protein n=1 Tax=Escherichia phage EcS1 TaxID=2083276 RepID=A0A2Z5ZCN5_9CAUD|nr:Hoc-like head decoration [Escherichia phage EcS1]BBC78247.1 Hoc large outer capsid protein [Escherichia phage EcS1]